MEKLVGRMPLSVEQEIAGLKPSDRDDLLNHIARKKKSALPAFLLLMICVGHYAYLRCWGRQALMWFMMFSLAIPYYAGYQPFEDMKKEFADVTLLMSQPDFNIADPVLADRVREALNRTQALQDDPVVKYGSMLSLFALIWATVDVFRLRGMIKRYNQRMIMHFLKPLRSAYR